MSTGDTVKIFSDDTGDLFSSSPPPISPPPRPRPRARPEPPAPASGDAALAQRIYALSSPGAFSETCSTAEKTSTGQSAAVKIGVPRTLVKPFRLPFTRKRIWDNSDNDLERGPASSSSSTSQGPSRHAPRRRLGMTPARATVPAKPSAIVIPSRSTKFDMLQEEDLDLHSDPFPFVASSNSRRDASPSSPAQRSVRTRQTLSPLTENDLCVGTQQEHGETITTQSPSINATLETEPSPATLGASKHATRRSALGHFEWAEEFILAPRAEASQRKSRQEAESGDDVRIAGRSEVANCFDGNRASTPPYSSPQVRAPSSTPRGQHLGMQSQRHSADVERESVQEPGAYIPPSGWSQLPVESEPGLDTPSAARQRDREDHAWTFQPESEDAIIRAPYHATNELSCALRSGSCAQPRGESVDENEMAGISTGLPPQEGFNLGPVTDEGHGLSDDIQRGTRAGGDEFADDGDDTENGTRADETSTLPHADYGAGLGLEAADDDQELDGTDLPSLAALESSMRIRIVATADARPDGA
ncbi:hypothetical protein V8E36_008266 [Tilletia maclaganii]